MNSEQIDSDGRLSIEFANHNWFLEKYRLQSNAPGPDVPNDIITPQIKKRKHRKSSNADSEKTKKKHKRKLTALSHPTTVLPPPTDHTEHRRLIGTERPQLDNDMSHCSDTACFSYETSLQPGIISEKQRFDLNASKESTEFKILEVVSLAGYVAHEKEHSDAGSTNVQIDGNSLSTDINELVRVPLSKKCGLPDVVPPEDECMDIKPEDLSIKPCDDEPKPLDLSMTSSKCIALDLSVKSRETHMPPTMSMTHAVFDNKRAESVYTCFNLTDSKRGKSTGSASDDAHISSPAYTQGSSAIDNIMSLSNYRPPTFTAMMSHNPPRLPGHMKGMDICDAPLPAMKSIPAAFAATNTDFKTTELNAKYSHPPICDTLISSVSKVNQASHNPLPVAITRCVPASTPVMPQLLATFPSKGTKAHISVSAVTTPMASEPRDLVSNSQLREQIGYKLSVPSIGSPKISSDLNLPSPSHLLKMQRETTHTDHAGSEMGQSPHICTQSSITPTKSTLPVTVTSHTTHISYAHLPLPYPRHLPENIQRPPVYDRTAPLAQSKPVADHLTPTGNDASTLPLTFLPGVLSPEKKQEYIGQLQMVSNVCSYQTTHTYPAINFT